MPLELELQHQQEQRLSPKMLQFYAMLQMPALELEQLIEQEMAENPALELAEEPLCSACGAELTGPICWECLYRNRPPAAPIRELDWLEEGLPDPFPTEEFETEEWEGEDPFARLEAPFTLRDYLRWNFRALAAQEDQAIGQRLIDEITPAGYLEADLGEVAAEFQVPLARVEAVLRSIQQLDPIGVGARNLQECLQIQLAYLAEQGEGQPLAARLVTECWAELGRHHYVECARKLGVRKADVQRAVDFIHDHLTPYPGQEFRPPWKTTSPDQVPSVRPEVIVRATHNPEEPYQVEVPASPTLRLRISRVYASAWREIQRTGRASAEERQHVRHYLIRAQQFLDNLIQRRETLKNITECIVREQYAFLERGILHLKPLTRLQVAARLGIHESTVGRAVAGKYVLLPSGEVVSFDLFFESALPAKRIIQRLVETEDPRRPLSDSALVQLLAERGFKLARRTVAKYREELHILPYFQRKRVD